MSVLRAAGRRCNSGTAIAARLSIAVIFGVASAALVAPGEAQAALPFLGGMRTLIADSSEFLSLYVGAIIVIAGICIGAFQLITNKGSGAATIVVALVIAIICGGAVELARYAYGLGGGAAPAI